MNNSILGDGCVVRAGCTINHSVIGLRSLIGAGTTIEDALIMGCDFVFSLQKTSSISRNSQHPCLPRCTQVAVRTRSSRACYQLRASSGTAAKYLISLAVQMVC